MHIDASVWYFINTEKKIADSPSVKIVCTHIIVKVAVCILYMHRVSSINLNQSRISLSLHPKRLLIQDERVHSVYSAYNNNTRVALAAEDDEYKHLLVDI